MTSQDRFTLHLGDCLEVMRTLAPESIDAVVTDPPAGISFMGKRWDHHKGGRDEWVSWMTEVMRECLRVLKPGGHAFVWALPRTSHWTAWAVESAGFEIRDVVHHLFGEGFPKSMDVSKAIDRAAGAEREVVGMGATDCEYLRRGEPCKGHGDAGKSQSGATIHVPITAPATDAARQWQGWGTALKPAAEHWILARKPFRGTVAANVLAHGTGAINVDASRIGTESTPRKDPQNGRLVNAHMEMRPWMKRRIEEGEPLKGDFAGNQGRFPANVITDGSEEVLAGFPESVSRPVKPENIGVSGDGHSGMFGATSTVRSGYYDSDASAARFFYTAKADRDDRDEGLEGMQAKQLSHDGRQTPIENPYQRNDSIARNHHPTVKPVELMRYLCRLITPPDGLILDPFMGSGSTGKAAAIEGFRFIGIEAEQEYLEIARRRIAYAVGPLLAGLYGLDA